ncbi:MAG TPA: helix-turn-helix domain-containing protein [Allosphingosinicella sp.]|nr:helix-turn-helix domain-containing protein [Allosphingosinicella sp.]
MNYEPQSFDAPDGTEMVILKASEYARLKRLAGEDEEEQDVADARKALEEIRDGAGTMPAEVLDLILDEGAPPLAAWRRYRGLSQAELARRAGLSQVWISRIERGGGYGSRDTRRKLAAALDAPLWAIEDDRDP